MFLKFLNQMKKYYIALIWWNFSLILFQHLRHAPQGALFVGLLVSRLPFPEISSQHFTFKYPFGPCFNSLLKNVISSIYQNFFFSTLFDQLFSYI